MPKFTIDALYEAFMDMDTEEETPFAEDVFNFFDMEDKGWEMDTWVRNYQRYLPTFDPTQINLAKRERDLNYRDHWNRLDTTRKATENVYNTEQDTLSTQLGKELEAGKDIAGRLGLRSGGLDTLIEETADQYATKSVNLSDRFEIQQQADTDSHQISMVDSALKFDKTVAKEKEDFYNRTLGAITRINDRGGMGQFVCEEWDMVTCDDGQCANDISECFTQVEEFDCALNPNLPECQDINMQEFNLGEVTFEMCQSDPSLEGCAGMYEEMDLNLDPSDYSTCPPGFAGTYPNCYSIDGSGINCSSPECVLGLWAAEMLEVPVGEMTQDMMQWIFGEGFGLWEDPENPCYWSGDNPCTDARCTETVDENGCRSCHCPDTAEGQPSGICTTNCSGATPYQCLDCSCVASADDCTNDNYYNFDNANYPEMP